MRNNLAFLKFATTIGILMLAVGFAFAADSPAATIGNTGHIWLGRTTQIDGVTLKPGHYRIWHEATNSQHVLFFHELGDPDLALQYSDQSFVGKPAAVKCRVETLATPAKHTTVTTAPDGRAQRITRIEIQGENVALLLEPGA